MRTFGTFEAKNHFSELLDLVEKGEEILITRRGKPVARLAMIDETAHSNRKQQALNALASMRDVLKAERVSFAPDEIIELRDSGRR